MGFLTMFQGLLVGFALALIYTHPEALYAVGIVAAFALAIVIGEIKEILEDEDDTDERDSDSRR